MISYWLERISPTIRIAGSGSWKKGHVEAARRIYDYEFVYFEDGTCEVEYDGKPLTFSSGSWMIVSPGVLHISRALTGNVRRYWVHFDWTWQKRQNELPVCVYAPATLEKRLIRKAPSFVPKTLFSGKIKEVSALPKLLDEIVAGDILKGRAIFLQLLLEILLPEKVPEQRNINGGQAFRLKALLDAMPSQDKSIRELSKTLGMTYEHLERVFKSSFGLSPLAYLNRLRIERAKSLMASGRYTVADAASAAGFNDAAYFSRAFRKHSGFSPSEFMKTSSNK